MEIAIGIVAVIIAACIGFVIARATERTDPIGILRIDNSDPDDGPYLFLELTRTTNPNTLRNQKYVTLRVKAENFIPHD